MIQKLLQQTSKSKESTTNANFTSNNDISPSAKTNQSIHITMMDKDKSGKGKRRYIKKVLYQVISIKISLIGWSI